MKLFKGKLEWKNDYKLIVDRNWFEVLDSKDNIIYFETSNGYWIHSGFDKNNNEIYFEDSYGEVIDNRKLTIELTQEQLNKIKDML